MNKNSCTYLWTIRLQVFLRNAFKKKWSHVRLIIDIKELDKLNKDMKQKQKIWKKNCYLFKMKHESRKFWSKAVRKRAKSVHNKASVNANQNIISTRPDPWGADALWQAHFTSVLMQFQ